MPFKRLWLRIASAPVLLPLNLSVACAQLRQSHCMPSNLDLNLVSRWCDASSRSHLDLTGELLVNRGWRGARWGGLPTDWILLLLVSLGR